jgi:glycosyltransferase involved in cell wall biosynthesis
MRILHLDTGREMRGGQWQVLHLLDGLCGLGLETTLLACGPLLEQCRRKGLPATEISLAAVRRAVASADVVHAHDARAHSLGALSGHRRLVVSRRVGFEIKRGWLSRWKYSRAALYVAVSRYVAAKLEIAGVPREQIRVIYDGVPALEPLPAHGRIVAPASGDPRKGSAILIRAGLDILFSPDLAADIPGAGAFVYLSEEEGLGSAVLLAMSAGVPVIASHVGGLPEIVEHEVTGLLVDNTGMAVAAALERLRSDPAGARRMGEAGRQRYGREFTVDRMVRQNVEIYREVAGA